MRVIILKTIFILLTTTLSTSAFSAPLKHAILDSDSAVSFQTQHVCHSIAQQDQNLACIPATYLEEPNGKIGVNTMVKANEKAYHIVSRFTDHDVSKEFVESLFEEDNFQSASGTLKAEAIYSSTAITYTPLHVAGALKVSNPSLPQVTVAGFSQSIFRVTQNFLGNPDFISNWGAIFFTFSPFYYSRTSVYLDTDLYSLSVLKVKDLIEKEKKNGVDGDAGFAIIPAKPWVPGISLRVNNVSTNPNSTSDNKITLDNINGRSSEISISSSVNHKIGKSLFGSSMQFRDVYGKYDKDALAVSYTFQLTHLGTFLSASQDMTSFGFIFHSKAYLLGIQYTNETQDEDLTIRQQKQAYVYGSFYF